MAIGIHVARVNFMPVNSVGTVVDKNAELSAGASIREMTDFSNEHRIIEDLTIASSVDSPTVKDYLEAEAAIDFVLHYMDQNTIVTYEHGAGPLP